MELWNLQQSYEIDLHMSAVKQESKYKIELHLIPNTYHPFQQNILNHLFGNDCES